MYSGLAFEKFVKDMSRAKFPRDVSPKTKMGKKTSDKL